MLLFALSSSCICSGAPPSELVAAEIVVEPVAVASRLPAVTPRGRGLRRSARARCSRSWKTLSSDLSAGNTIDCIAGLPTITVVAVAAEQHVGEACATVQHVVATTHPAALAALLLTRWLSSVDAVDRRGAGQLWWSLDIGGIGANVTLLPHPVSVPSLEFRARSRRRCRRQLSLPAPPAIVASCAAVEQVVAGIAVSWLSSALPVLPSCLVLAMTLSGWRRACRPASSAPHQLPAAAPGDDIAGRIDDIGVVAGPAAHRRCRCRRRGDCYLRCRGSVAERVPVPSIAALLVSVRCSTLLPRAQFHAGQHAIGKFPLRFPDHRVAGIVHDVNVVARRRPAYPPCRQLSSVSFPPRPPRGGSLRRCRVRSLASVSRLYHLRLAPPCSNARGLEVGAQRKHRRQDAVDFAGEDDW